MTIDECKSICTRTTLHGVVPNQAQGITPWFPRFHMWWFLGRSPTDELEVSGVKSDWPTLRKCVSRLHYLEKCFSISVFSDLYRFYKAEGRTFHFSLWLLLILLSKLLGNFVSFRFVVPPPSTYLFTVGVEVVYFHLITLRHTPQSVGLL
jgi:hypothetical protein